jgi:hypothetical protein
MNPFQQKVSREKTEGCKIKVSRDEQGRIKSISTNGKCSKEEVAIFRENLNQIDESEGED